MTTNAASIAPENRQALRCNAARLWDSLMQLARIGATPAGGVRRLTLTDLDGEARRHAIDWLRDCGCSIRIDAIGNIHATRPGTEELDPIGIGSHLDTQPNGGRFDGSYGVMAGLEVLRCLEDHGIRTRHPVNVTIWTNEEGSRFTPVMMGSGVYAGAFTLEHCLAQRDRYGRSVEEALEAIGFAGRDEAPSLAAYFEPHIEQGPILEEEGITIGAVETALGQRWFDVVVTGQDAHAGPTPLSMRRDALLGAARIVAAVRRIAETHPDEARGTVGQLDVTPNSRNVIPGRVALTVDLRNARDETLSRMVDALRAECAAIAEQDRLEISLDEVVYFPPCRFDPALVALVERAAERVGHSRRRIASGAGHDAVYVARRHRAAMIFVPCEGGISHNEAENAQPEHLAAGTDVLLEAVLAFDRGEA